MKTKFPLKLAICSWAKGIGGGAGRMEAYYYQYYDRMFIDPILVSLIPRSVEEESYDQSIPYYQIDQGNRFFDLVSFLRNQEIDVVQFQGSFDPLVCEAARVAGVPLLIEVLHNIEAGGHFSNIDCTICVSQSVKSAQTNSDNAITILNGINLNQFPYVEKKERGEKIIILQVGRRSKSSVNLDDVARIMPEYRDKIEFWICGGEQCLEDFENVRFLGIEADIQQLYCKADFLVQLSDNEPFGLVALEAMAMGTPVILSNSGGFKEIVLNQVDGYLVDQPYALHAKKVIESALIERDLPLYNQIRREARKKVEDKFQISDVVKKYQDLIIGLVDEKKEFQRIKQSNSDLLVICPNALVGEALYDFQCGSYNVLVPRLKQLSNCREPISEIYCLRTAHQLALFVRLQLPDKFPKGIFAYLFGCGNVVREALLYCCDELDELKSRGLYDQFKIWLRDNAEADVELMQLFLARCQRL